MPPPMISRTDLPRIRSLQYEWPADYTAIELPECRCGDGCFGKGLAMKRRKLGLQGLEVSALGLGCMGMSQSYGSDFDDAESVATIHRAIALGVDFFDTAEVYGPFVNEELVGRALQGKRGQVVIATKFGFAIRDGQIAGVDSRPENIRQVADASLRRLVSDRIDLLYQHRVDQ